MADRRIFLSHGEVSLNRELAKYWSAMGHHVGLQCASVVTDDDLHGGSHHSYQDDCHLYYTNAEDAISHGLADREGLDLVVHGVEELDEEDGWTEDPLRLAQNIMAEFERMHQINRMALRRFIGQRRGHLLFLLRHAPDGRQSPIMRAGKLALMQAIAKEVKPGISIHAVTLVGSVAVDATVFSSLDTVLALGGHLHGQNIQLGGR